MIEVINRELLIPREEYNIGTCYDDNTETRHFHLKRVTSGGVDLAALTFNLDIQYADGNTDAASLVKEVTDKDINLVLTINNSMLQVPGTVLVQIRALDEDGVCKWTSYKSAFFVEDHINTPGHYEGDLTQLEQYEAEWGKVRDNVNQLNLRMDEVVRIREESPATEVEEEVIDARVGADNVVYGSLGTAVRKQFENVYEKMEEDTGDWTAAVAAEATARANADTDEATARQTADNTLQGNINTEASTRAANDASLQTQINQIVAPTGEAPNPSEITNARIGADGKTYNTLGEAIRGNDTRLQSVIKTNYANSEKVYTVASINLFNKDDVELGSMNSSGAEVVVDNWYRTKTPVPCNGEKIICNFNIYPYFYDSAFTFISRGENTESNDVPVGTSYVRFCIKKTTYDSYSDSIMVNIGEDVLPYKAFNLEGEIKESLKLLHTDLSCVTVLSTATDYDDLTTAGEYVVLNSTALALMTHCPSDTAHRLIVMETVNPGIRPIQVVIDTKNNIFIRSYVSTGWRAWKRFADNSDVETINNDIFHLNIDSVTVLSTATDYNDLTTPADYVVKTSTALALMTHCPSNMAHRLIVMDSNSAGLRPIQIVIDLNNNIFIRSYVSTGWRAWSKLANEALVDSKIESFSNVNSILLASNEQIIESFSSKYMTLQSGKVAGAAIHEKLVVAHITDTHNDTTRMDRFVNYLNEHSIVDFGIHTGDTNLGNYYADMVEGANKPIYIALGNHDGDAFYESGTYCASINASFFTSAVKTKLGITPNARNYYYVDNSDYEATIRFIFLNEYDYPDGLKASDMPEAAKGFYNSIYGQDQIDWFINVLKDCITNNYYAVVCSHQKPNIIIPNTKSFYQYGGITGQSQNYTGDILGDIINAYKNGGSLNQTYPAMYSQLSDVTVNTTFAGNGKFICFINGHNHADRIGYNSSYSDQLVLNGPFGRATVMSNNLFSDMPRSTDTETQDNFNVYVFDIENECVHVVKIGSNLTFDGKIRKYEKYDF